jgi:hypothetical protein
MNIGFFVIAASILLIVCAVLLFILTQDEGSGLGKACTITSECASGFICDNGSCKIPIGGSCIETPNACVTGSSCVNGVCISNIIPPKPIPSKCNKKNKQSSPCSPKKQSSPCSPKKQSSSCSPKNQSSNSSPNCNPADKNISNIIQGTGSGTLYYNNTLKSKSPTKLSKGVILGSAYYNERVYFLTSSSSAIQVYNLVTKTFEPTIAQNLTNITGLESTSDGMLYARVGNTIYYGVIPQPLLGTSITWTQMNSPAVYEITTAPNRSILHMITNHNQANTIYTDDVNVIMYLYSTTVDIITNGTLETLSRPNGKYPLYKNGKIKWTDYYNRYFLDIVNNTSQEIFLYIAP